MPITPHILANLHNYPGWGTSGGPASLSGTNNINCSSSSSNVNFTARTTKGKSAGKWYAEILSAASQYSSVGIVTASADLSTYVGGDANGYGYAEILDTPNPGDIGVIYNNATVVSSPATHMKSVMGIALDISGNTIYWYGDNSLITSATIPSGQTWYIAWGGFQGNALGETGTIYAGPVTNYNPPAGFERWYW